MFVGGLAAVPKLLTHYFGRETTTGVIRWWYLVALHKIRGLTRKRGTCVWSSSRTIEMAVAVVRWRGSNGVGLPV